MYIRSERINIIFEIIIIITSTPCGESERVFDSYSNLELNYSVLVRFIKLSLFIKWSSWVKVFGGPEGPSKYLYESLRTFYVTDVCAKKVGFWGSKIFFHFHFHFLVFRPKNFFFQKCVFWPNFTLKTIFTKKNFFWPPPYPDHSSPI